MRSKIALLWKSGCDTKEIAEALGVHESRVYNEMGRMLDAGWTVHS